MARIDWLLVCDTAFFDRHDRLCVIGVVKTFVVPQLPLALNQLMIVARLTDLRQVEEFSIAVGVVAPGGVVAASAAAVDAVVEVSGEYVLATLREVPLFEEGHYGFRMALSDQAPVTIDVSVTTFRESIPANVH